MEHSSVIRLGTFKESLGGVSIPIGSRVRESLVAFLSADGERVGQAYREQKSTELAKAEAEEEQLRFGLKTHQTLLDETKQLVEGMSAGSWLMGIVSLTCFFLCFVAEYVFNAAVMPWLVSVPPRSLLGLALSMAPATAPVILDRVIIALFDVDDSWQAVKAALLSPLNRLARASLRIGFLTAVGALNLHAIWLLADARGVASTLKNSDGATTITSDQQGKIDAALLMVSIAVTIDGALFYLFGLHEIHSAHGLLKAKRDLAGLRAAQDSLLAAHSAAAAVLVGVRRVWEDIDSLQKSVGGAYFAEGMVQLEEMASKHAPARPARELALEILGRPDALAAGRAGG